MAAENAPTPRPVASKPKARGTIASQAAAIRREADEATAQADPAALASRDSFRFLPEHLDVLDRISAGEPVRNAPSVIAAARLRADWLWAKPAQGVAVDQRVTINVLDPYAHGDGVIEVEVTPRPALLSKRADETASEYAERLVREREAQVIAARAKAP